MRLPEDFYQFLWQHILWTSHSFENDEGQRIEIVRPGKKNISQGPDFFDAHIKIDGVDWYGAVELHVKAEDWQAHGHHTDPQYNRVILHVYAEGLAPAYRLDGSPVPGVCMARYVPEKQKAVYLWLKQATNTGKPTCQSLWPTVPEVHKRAMLDRLALHRLQRKADEITAIWEAVGKNWEETAFITLAMGLGFSNNRTAFKNLAEGLTSALLMKHRDQPHQIRALIMGFSGIMGSVYVPIDDKLKNEYQYLSHKYNLHTKAMRPEMWNAGGSRPGASFVSGLVRLCVWMSSFTHVFEILTQNTLPDVLWTALELPMDMNIKKYPATLSVMLREVFTINTLAPFRLAYHADADTATAVMEMLRTMPAENNRITRDWQSMGLQLHDAADSQAAIEWRKNYCIPQNCLSCAVGQYIMRKSA